MLAKTIMIQGTGSSVGKSVLTAALCRIFTEDGYRVRPFKAQNMSNNAFVTRDGGEISRAQAEQAKACGIEPAVAMNPILLKPTTDLGAQVVLLGQAQAMMTFQEYQAQRPRWIEAIQESLRAMRAQADIVVIEGAGSPAEVNLQDRDLVNMWVAREADAPVILVGDIDRGGVFAQLVGTLELLAPADRARVCGFIINKFRGDPELLEPGLRWLEGRCGVPVLGVVPFWRDLWLAEEDTPTFRSQPKIRMTQALRIEVVRLPRISNFTDFDALTPEEDVALTYVERPSVDEFPDVLILPGSKSTIADLAFLREQGFVEYLARLRQAGREIIGICGGFQMLSERVCDPEHLEASVGEAPGLGLLPGVARFRWPKTTRQARAVHLAAGLPVEGYEIHLGQMEPVGSARPVFQYLGDDGQPIDRYDGLQSADGLVWGTHLHGIFDAPEFRAWWLNRLRRRRGWAPLTSKGSANGHDPYQQLAAWVRPYLKMDCIYACVEERRRAPSESVSP